MSIKNGLWIINTTRNPIGIGDLNKLPTIDPGKIINLLDRHNQKDINGSKNLSELLVSGEIKYISFETAAKKASKPKVEATLLVEGDKVELPSLIFGTKISPDNPSALGQYLGYQLVNYNIPEMWKETKGEGITIAVLDTGCDTNHRDLSGSFVNSASDGHGHGTHVSGIITANNNQLGISGVAPEAKILVVKVLDDNGFGSSRSVADGIQTAIDHNVDIISMSLGGPSPMDDIHFAIKKAYDKGIPVICAAGNAGDIGHLAYPGSYQETISIGALDKKNLRAWFSQTGPSLDFMAPGVSVLSTIPGNRWQFMSGSSMACPWAAGVVALMISKHRKHGGRTPLDSVEDVRDHLRKTSIDIDDVGFDQNTGFGLIDVREALDDENLLDKYPRIIVSAAQGDAPGTESDNLTDEWVEFFNIGDINEDLSDCKMVDKAGWEFKFPQGFILKSNSKVRVRTGKGSNTSTDLFWGYRRAVLNNDGDIIWLIDKNEQIITEYKYGTEAIQ